MAEKRKNETAAELMARLRADPEWVRRHEGREAAHKARVEQGYREREPENAPLIQELKAAGIKFRPSQIQQWTSGGRVTSSDPTPVGSVWDLVNTKHSYPEAIPILYRHLQTAKHPEMVEGIARALTVKEACGPQARCILEKLQRRDFLVSTPTVQPHQNHAAWALANALVVVGDESMVEEIKALIADPRYADVKGRLKDALKHCERLAKRNSGHSAR